MDSIYESIVSTIDQDYHSKKDSDYSYSSLSSSKDIADFNRNMQIVFKSKNDMSKEKTHKSMKAIKFNGEIIGYIGFSRYNIDGKKYLGIGNFMIIPRYQSSGHGTKVIKDLIDRYKDTYDEIYCYVEKENTKAIQFYKRIADVNTKNLTKYGYYVCLYRKGGSSMNESNIINQKDIYYNKDKFDSGEINLCFITGHSGSGKSTMARSMQNSKVEHYELDDLNQNYKFTDENLKEYGDLIYSFFKGPGKKYRYHSYEDMQNCTNPLDDSGDEFDKCVNRDFIKYAMKYANSHKNTKFVIEGIWLYFFFKPEELKDYAVYIKGTSRILSAFRAAKRDSKDADNKTKRFLYSIKGTISTLYNKYSREGEKLINKYRDYYGKLEKVDESYIEESKTSKRLYHVSQSNLDGKTIQPSVPNNFMTKNGYEDGKTKRVCFSSFIDGCLRALSQKCTGMKLYVHIPDGEYDVYKPSVKEVPDVKITKEVWIKEPVKLKCIGKIDVIGDRGEDGLPYKYGNNTAELYDWDWKWVEKVDESYIEESKKDDDIFITIPDIDKDHIRTVIKTLSNDIDNFQDLLFIKVFDYNIAFDNGKPVGFILVRLKPLGNDKYAGSISIAVDPKQRRKGLAEFLTKNMIEDCRKEDRIEYLYWNALIKNTASINLAKKLKFKFEGNKKGEEGMYKKFIYPLKKQMNESYIEESLNLLKKLDEEKVSKEILDTIKPIILTSQNKSKASKLSLDLKCEITEVDSGMVFILVLDGPQEKRDTEEARSLLKDLASKCKLELSDIVSKVDIGDGDEGCLFFTMDKCKIRRKRKDLLESTIEESDIGNKSIVFFTKNITPESLLKIYHTMTDPLYGVAPLHGNIGVKISTGEYGGHNFLQPVLIKDLVQYLHGVIVECNTAYVGKRNTTEDHWNTIKSHGFLDIANCDIMDEDGDFPLPVKDPYHIKNNYVGNHLKRYDSILMLSHFEGHDMAGYSGALKNMSIGMASSRGKFHIHTAWDNSADMMKADRDKFLESMVDADMSVMDYMGRENILYVNVANNLSIDCDCDAHPKDQDISDIGIFASTDPVALDQACIDAVYNHPEEKKRNLINRITSRNGMHTIDCAYEKGLGNKEYVILDIDQIIEESVIEEDASVIAAGIFLAVFYGGIAAAKIHQKIKPYLDERKFVYDVSFSNKVRDYNYGYKTPKDAIVGYASILNIKAEKGVLLYTDKSSLKDNVKLFKYNKKKKTDIIFDGTYEELCEKYGIKLKPFDKSKLKDRDKVYKQAQSLLKKELSKYPMLKKIDASNDKDEYDKFISGMEDYVGIYYSSLWDLVKNARSPEGVQLADEEIWKPLIEILKDINDKLPDGYEIVIDNGDWDDISIDLQHTIKLNESVIEEDIENEWAPASFLKRSSKPAKNQKAHSQYLKRKAHSNKTNNATAQSELPKYNQIGEESIEEAAKSQRVKPIFIVTSYTNTAFGKAIKTFTHSQYTHAAIAFDTSLEELYSFNADPKYSSNGYKGGISKESLSSYIDSYDKTIIKVNCIFLKPSDFDKVKETLDKLIENKEDTSYGYLNILNILIGRAKDTGMAMVCSQFVSYILSTADIRLLDKPDNIVTPKDLSTITNPRVYKIFEGYAKDYEKKRMDRIFRKLKTKALLIKENLLDLCI